MITARELMLRVHFGDEADLDQLHPEDRGAVEILVDAIEARGWRLAPSHVVDRRIDVGRLAEAMHNEHWGHDVDAEPSDEPMCRAIDDRVARQVTDEYDRLAVADVAPSGVGGTDR